MSNFIDRILPPTRDHDRSDGPVSIDPEKIERIHVEGISRTTKLGTELMEGDVLLGDSGGRSVVYEVNSSSSIPGLLAVETEHGFLYLDPESSYTVIPFVS